MSRTTLWLSLALVLLALPIRSQAADEKKSRPNILFIYTDDHSHRTVSCYPEAYPWARTPNIDALAKRGVRFTHAYIGTWCMPSRATLLTGHHQYGVDSMRMVGEYPGSEYDPAKCPFWPKVFRENGYVTAQIGKWHTGTDTGANRDWDYQAVWNRPRYPKNAGNYYKDQLIEINGAKPKLVKGYTTDNYTEWAGKFIRGAHRDKDKPWYLWVCYGAVHGPFTPAKRHQKAYSDLKVPTPKDIYPPRPGKPAYMQKINYWAKGKDGQPFMKGPGFQAQTVNTQGIHGNTLTDWVRQYHQGVLAIDEGVGKLMAALKESGQLDNTLVVFTSDQGFAWGQHGFRTKLAPYDANIRSPMIVSMPSKLPVGKVCRTPVGGTDLVPTFFRFAGIDLPWAMHGRDITPLLHHPEAKSDHQVLTAFTARLYGSDTDRVPTDPKLRDINGIPWWISLRKGKYKYIRTLVKDEIEELYDMDNDPEELTNLAIQKKFAATLAEFRTATVAELRRTKAGMADHLPAVKTPAR
jgi:arylsulfatase A-like enzyme